MICIKHKLSSWFGIINFPMITKQWYHHILFLVPENQFGIFSPQSQDLTFFHFFF